MALIEIKCVSENIAFFKSLRDSNVERDLAIKGENGTVFVHRRVLQTFSSVIKSLPPEVAKIELECVLVEDLLTIVNLCYEGKVGVRRDRLHTLFELSKIIGFSRLEKMLADISEEQKQTDNVIQVPHSEPSGDKECQQVLDDLQEKEMPTEKDQVDNMSGEDGNNEKQTEEDEEIDILTVHEEDAVTTDSHLDKDKNTACLLPGNNLSRQSFTRKTWLPGGEICEAMHDEKIINYYIRQEEERACYLSRKHAYNKWTKEQNKLFLESWLNHVQSKSSEANVKMAEMLTQNGLLVTRQNIVSRKNMFRRMYQKYLKGQSQSYILEYLDQLKKIFKFERDAKKSSYKAINSVSDSTSKNNGSKGVKVVVSTARGRCRKIVDVGTEKSKTAVEFSEGSRCNCNSSSCQTTVLESELPVKSVAADVQVLDKGTMTSESDCTNMKKSSAVRKELQKRSRLNWTPKLNILFLKFWLKKAKNEWPDANARLIQVLDNNNIILEPKSIEAKKSYFRKKYQSHINGFPERSLKRYLSLLQKIHQYETKSFTACQSSQVELYDGKKEWKAPQRGFPWTEKMTRVLLEVWLKYACRGFQTCSWDLIASEIVDTLAQMQYEVSIEKVLSKMDRVHKKYKDYIEGRSSPSVVPHLTLLAKIHNVFQED